MYRFLTAHAASALCLGVHLVLVAWLAVDFLDLSSIKLAWVQAAGLLPSLFFLLFAGVTADSFSTRRVILLAQFSLALTYAFLAATLLFAWLSGEAGYWYLLIYSAFTGTANAFLIPAREKWVAQHESIEGNVGANLHQRLSLSSMVQFVAQSVGIFLVALQDYINLAYLVVFQSLLAFFAVFVFLGIEQAPTPGKKVNLNNGFKQGLVALKGQPALKQLLVLAGFNGLVHMGVFLVLIPQLARHHYQFSVFSFSLVQFSFVAGMVAAHWQSWKKAEIEFPGQGALFSLLYTAVIGFALAKMPLPAGFFILVVFWGWTAGMSANRCRLCLQRLSPDALKGRLTSMYQLALFGMAPIGAIIVGYVLNFEGFSFVLNLMSGLSIVMFVLFLLSKKLWAVNH